MNHKYLHKVYYISKTKNYRNTEKQLIQYFPQSKIEWKKAFYFSNEYQKRMNQTKYLAKNNQLSLVAYNYYTKIKKEICDFNYDILPIGATGLLISNKQIYQQILNLDLHDNYYYAIAEDDIIFSYNKTNTLKQLHYIDSFFRKNAKESAIFICNQRINLKKKNFQKGDVCIDGTQLVFINKKAAKKCLQFITPYNLPLDVFYATLFNIDEIKHLETTYNLVDQKYHKSDIEHYIWNYIRKNIFLYLFILLLFINLIAITFLLNTREN